MATYYRWRQSNYSYEQNTEEVGTIATVASGASSVFYSNVPLTISNGKYILSEKVSTTSGRWQNFPDPVYAVSRYRSTSEAFVPNTTSGTQYSNSGNIMYIQNANGIKKQTISIIIGNTVGYVYSTSSSAYPNGGVQGDYYYDQRTTITSPTAPTNLQYPNPITTPTVTVSWGASTSNVPGVTIDHYYVFPYVNNIPFGPNGVIVPASSTSVEMQIPTTYNGNPVTSIQFGIGAYDSNNRGSLQSTGEWVPVYLAPTLTVPSLAMQGEGITVNWTAIDGATSYTLQRKANTDADWVQVYSGPNLTFTETVGTWASVQYQVQAVFSSGAGGWATSASIPVVSASALVISGTDEDLGTLTADIPYTVSSDTGNPITLTRTVNGNVVATLTVQNGFAYTIPVMDLPTGSGTIEISASVTATSGPVSATRTWTYTKTAITFPNSASVGQLNQDGTNIFPATLAEAVKVPTHWGGTLDKALELLYDAANSAVISVGTYEGSGTYGVDNPNTLTISPSPQVVTIYGGGQTLVISSTDTSSPAYIDGTTVKWYSTVSAAEQMNTDGVTYSYVAVAKGVTA